MNKNRIFLSVIIFVLIIGVLVIVNYYKSYHRTWNISLDKDDDNLSAEVNRINNEIWLYIIGEGDMISMTEDSTFSQNGRAWRKKPYQIKKCFIYEGCKSIGSKAFSNCTELGYINLPNSINKIECFAFENCISLKVIEYQGSIEMWQQIQLDSSWKKNSKIKLIKCNNGIINLE